MKRILFYYLNSSQRLWLRRFFYLPQDIWDSINGKSKNKLSPPRGLVFVGYGDFRKQGENFLEYFKVHGGLQPDARVLDIGSGIGRMAIPMIDYIGNRGSYEGLDIVKQGVDWCRKNISRKHGNFNFRHADIYNKLYNSKGKILAREYQFPFQNNSFDFIFLTSVFTHMMPHEVENYIEEISRLLKNKGKVFITFFLLNDESEKALKQGTSHMEFKYDFGHYRLQNAITDTANVAFREDYILKLLNDAGLKAEQTHYGKWCGRSKYLDYQDIMIISKK